MLHMHSNPRVVMASMRSIAGAVAVSLCLLGCSASQPQNEASGATSAPADARSGAGSARGPDYPMPTTIQADVHVPGPEAERYLTGTIEQDGGSWFLIGCFSSLRGSCRATSRAALSDADTRRIRTELALVFTTPVSCAQWTPEPGDREYRLTIDGNTHTGFLPADPAAIPGRTQDNVCRAMDRLAWWIVQRFNQR